MAKYLYVYHGGSMPDNPEEGAQRMDQWGKWMGGLGSALVDGGNPVGQSSTVHGDGSVTTGGENLASGYSLVEASDLDDALAKAKGCPILNHGGTIEVAEAMDM